MSATILCLTRTQNKSTEISDVKLKIRKNKAGLVVVEGSVIRPASTAEELYSLFEQGAAARYGHVGNSIGAYFQLYGC